MLRLAVLHPLENLRLVLSQTYFKYSPVLDETGALMLPSFLEASAFDATAFDGEPEGNDLVKNMILGKAEILKECFTSNRLALKGSFALG